MTGTLEVSLLDDPNGNDENLDSEAQLSTGRRVVKYFSLLDLALPITWIYIGCSGSIMNTITSFILTVLYSYGINNVRNVTLRRSRSPSLIVIFSMILSAGFIIASVALYYLQTGGKVKRIPWLDYLDLNPTSPVNNLVIGHILSLVVDILFFIVTSTMTDKQIRSAKLVVIPGLNRLNGCLFILSLGLAIATNMNYFMIPLGVIFILSTFCYGIFSRPFNRILVNFTWWFFMVVIFYSVVVTSSDLIFTNRHDFPRWLQMMSLLIAGFCGSIFWTNNRCSYISPIRLVGTYKMPYIIKVIAPFVVVITSVLNVLLQQSWQSTVCFFIAALSSLFGHAWFVALSPYVFAANTIINCLQFVPYTQTDSSAALVTMFMMTSLSAIMMSNQGGTLLPGIEDLSPVTVFYRGLFTIFLQVVLTAGFGVFSTYFKTYLQSGLCAILNLFSVLCFNNVVSWTIINFFVLIGASVQMVFILLDFNPIDSLFIPGTTWRATWPLLACFLVTLILKFTYVPPRQPQTMLGPYGILIVIIGALVCVLPNSAFQIWYFIVFNLLFFVNKKMTLMYITAVFCFFNAIILQVDHCGLYTFGPRLALILGIHRDHYEMLDLCLLSCYIVLTVAIYKMRAPTIRRENLNQVVMMIIDNIKYFFGEYAFYFLMLGSFFSTYFEPKVTLMVVIVHLSVCTYRLFAQLNMYFLFCCYIIFDLTFLFQDVLVMIGIKGKLMTYAELIGPCIGDRISRLLSLLLITSVVLYAKAWQFKGQFSPVFVKYTRYIKKNLIIIAQISLSIAVLYSEHVLAPFSAILLFIIVLKKKIGKVFATSFNLVLVLLMGYEHLMKIWPLDKDNEWFNYLLLSGASKSDLAHTFTQLFIFTFYHEYGLGEMPGFGETIFTAYGFSIMSSIISVISLTVYHYAGLIHTALWMWTIFYSFKQMKAWKLGIYLCQTYSGACLILMSIRYTPFFPNIKPLDVCLGLGEEFNVQWVLIFAFESLITAMVSSQDYDDVQSRQDTRILFRKRRNDIIRDLQQIDHDYLNENFDKVLVSLSVGAEQLLDPESAGEKTIDWSSKMNEPDEPLPGTPIASQQDAPQPETMVQKVWKVIKKILFFIVDKFIYLLCDTTDLNLEPGITLPYLEHLRQFMSRSLDIFKSKGKIYIPNGEKAFSETIPFSYSNQFRLLFKMKVNKLTDSNRFQVLLKYLAVFTRQLPHIILPVLALCYPLRQNSIIAFIWVFFPIFTIGLKLNNFYPYLIYSGAILCIKYILKMPYLAEIVQNFENDPAEQQRAISIFQLIGINSDPTIIAMDATMFIMSIFTLIEKHVHPNPELPPCEGGIFEKYKAKFSLLCACRIPFNGICFALDIIGFFVLLIFYTSWVSSASTLTTMFSGSSPISPGYVSWLVFHFLFTMLTVISINSKNSIMLLCDAILFAAFSYVTTMIVMPQTSQGNCLNQVSFNIYNLLRGFSTLMMAYNLCYGFNRKPPHISNRQPLLQYLVQMITSSVPFVFEFKVCMQWLSVKSSISLFDQLILSQVQGQLISTRSLSLAFPEEKQDHKKPNSHVLGYLFLVAMIVLLFFPLMLLSSSDTTNVLNPAIMANIQFGISGLPDIYVSQLNGISNQITNTQQRMIKDLGDTDLVQFYANKATQLQGFELVNSSNSEWGPSKGAIEFMLDRLINEEGDVSAYGIITLGFDRATTSNGQNSVTFNLEAVKLSDEAKSNLTQILNNTLSGVDDDELEIVINQFIPIFYSVPTESEEMVDENYKYDVKFKKIGTSWTMETDKSLLRFFSHSKTTEFIVWSQPVPDGLTESLLSSTGGIMGLYVFVIITIGGFLSSWVSGLYDGLWIDRMKNPTKLLRVLLAIEAYRLSGQLEKEWQLSDRLLELLREKSNLIKLTDVPEDEEEEVQEDSV